MQQKRIYQIGNFHIDSANHLLLRNGSPVQLQPKSFEMLCVLVEQRGKVITKDSLLKRLWPDAVVEESNLTQNIYLLRKVLGQEFQNPCIETIPKFGYRFVGEVKELDVDETDVDIEENTKMRVVVTNRKIKRFSERTANSLAVIPFVNLSADPQAEYLSDGITESIINMISQLQQLHVLASSIVFRYKGREINPQSIGRKLKVSILLLGHILQLGKRLIIRTELVDVKDGWQLWGAQYDRETIDVLAVQEEISREISEKLQLKLTGAELSH